MQLKLPITVQLEITDNCNFRCQHCYRLEDAERRFKESDDERIMEIARRLAEDQVYNIILTGGEPLTRPDLLKRLVKFLNDADCNVNINTNLTLLTDDLIECFIENDVRNLLVSCPSGIPEEYNKITRTSAFNVFEKNLRKLNESSIHHSINMVVNRMNVHSVRQTAEFVKECGSTRFGATPMSLNALYPRKDLLLSKKEVTDVLWELNAIHEELGMDIDVMEALPKCAVPRELVQKGLSFTRRKCQAGLTTAAISSNGDVRPCTHNPKSCGNMFERPLSEIWKDMSSWRDMTYVPEDCRDCALMSRCNGACRINALTMNGRLDARDIWMTEPISKSETIRDGRPVLTPETQVRMMKTKLKFRNEGDGYKLVFGRNGRQVAMVNDEVVKLIDMIGDKTMSIREIAAMGDAEPENEKLTSVLRHLISRRIMKIEQ